MKTTVVCCPCRYGSISLVRRIYTSMSLSKTKVSSRYRKLHAVSEQTQNRETTHQLPPRLSLAPCLDSSSIFLHRYVTASPTTTTHTHTLFGPTKSDEQALPAKSSIKFTHAFPVNTIFYFLKFRQDLSDCFVSKFLGKTGKNNESFCLLLYRFRLFASNK